MSATDPSRPAEQGTRKIQMTGGSTYIVSLPRNWIQSAGLRKGDSVNLRVTGTGALVVDPSTPREPVPLVKSIEIATSMEQTTLMRHLIGAYVIGYEVIEVRSKGRIPPNLRKVALDFSKRVIGPEVIEESACLVILQDVAAHADLDMRKVVRRMHLMATSMFEDSVRVLTGPHESIAGDVIARDDEVDRLHWFVERQHSMTRRHVSFATKLKMSWLESDSMLLAARAIERIADHSTKIAGYTTRLGDFKAESDVQDSLCVLATDTKAVLDDSIASLFRRDPTMANSCIERTIGLRGRAESFVEEVIKKRGKGAVWFAFAAASIERVGGYTSDISEIAINLSIGDDANA